MNKQNKSRFSSKLSKHFTVREEDILMNFLQNIAMKDQSRTTVKQVLRDRYISVNDIAVSQFDHKLNVGDIVRINANPLPEDLHHPKIKILWQDEYFVMISKGVGVPTVASGNEKDRTALRIVSDHLKKYDAKTKIFLLNRLDKDSAGLVLFAKNTDIQRDFIQHWSSYVKKQEFLVAVEGLIEEKSGELKAPEREANNEKKFSNAKKKFAMNRDPYGDEAGQATYRIIKEGDICSLLFINLEKGRNNQLRRQFAERGTPIAGDWRNGSTFKSLGHVALQGVRFQFMHPIDRIERTFTMPEMPVLGKLARMSSENKNKIRELKIRTKTK